jgi:hypothetical protein
MGAAALLSKWQVPCPEYMALFYQILYNYETHHDEVVGVEDEMKVREIEKVS